jgi:hypothetical protein
MGRKMRLLGKLLFLIGGVGVSGCNKNTNNHSATIDDKIYDTIGITIEQYID